MRSLSNTFQRYLAPSPLQRRLRLFVSTLLDATNYLIYHTESEYKFVFNIILIWTCILSFKDKTYFLFGVLFNIIFFEQEKLLRKTTYASNYLKNFRALFIKIPVSILGGRLNGFIERYNYIYYEQCTR